MVDLVIPVHNEQNDLELSVHRLLQYLRGSFPYSFRITIADNASNDSTPVVAGRLAAEHAEVVSVRLPHKGRGGALRAVWERSDAAVLAYCDVDLSSGLSALPVLIAPLLSGHSHLAIGTRLGVGATVIRSPKREIISRVYNLILRGVLGARFTDAQCGFKAIRSDTARILLPLVEDTGWFFDTELLVLAQRWRLRIHEVAVDWTEDPHSSVDIVATALADLRGVLRLLIHTRTATVEPGSRASAGHGSSGVDPRYGPRDRAPDGRPAGPRRLPREMVRFAGVGAASTVCYLLLFLALRVPLGPLVGNWVALILATAANTWANRRITFRLHGARHRIGHYLSNFAVMAAGLGLTSGALASLSGLWPQAGAPAQLAALTSANLVITVTRFVVFRRWSATPRGTATTQDTITSTTTAATATTTVDTTPAESDSRLGLVRNRRCGT